ncbi:MAG TPA: hypothetical protein VFQ54_04095, partial [Thermomicrobiales bacterium]|nr:hypothetical protein [Thermomicrobiales bacterium]
MTAVIKKVASTDSTSSSPDNPKIYTHRQGCTRFGRRRVVSIVGMIAIAAIVLATFHQSISSAQEEGSTPETSPVASPAATPDAGAQKLTVTFTEYNDSGIKGTATFYDEGARTLVVIDVKNAGTDHPAHIHAGTCNTLDPKAAYNLIDIHEDGQSSTYIDTSLSDLTASQFAIDLHLSPNDLGTMIACANISGTITNAQGTPVAPTPPATVTEETPTPETAVGGDGTSGSNMPTPTQIAGMGDNTTTEITPTSEAVTGETPTEPAEAVTTDETPTQAPAAVIIIGNETPTTEANGGDGAGAGAVWTSTNTSSALGT